MLPLLLHWSSVSLQTNDNNTNDSDDNSYRYADVDNVDDDCRDKWLYNGNICCTDALMQVSLIATRTVYWLSFYCGIYLMLMHALVLTVTASARDILYDHFTYL